MIIKRIISDRAVLEDLAAVARFINEEVRPLLREIRERVIDKHAYRTKGRL